MKKTRGFLLAASTSLALAFSLSCSSDDGSVVTIGTDGYWYIDGVKTDVKAAGKDGENGQGCDVEDGGAYLAIKCGGIEQARLPKALCGATAYDPETQFCDFRNIQLYTPVKIGEQIWMKENLNYNASGSKCYGNDSSNCAKYGRLYDWNTAMAVASSSTAVPSGVQGICPGGWHLPSDGEWYILVAAAGGLETAGAELRTNRGWAASDGIENFDTYGFSALPGGNGDSNGIFYNVGSGAVWWSASEDPNLSSRASSRSTYALNKKVNILHYDKSYLFSVRCLKD
jgi:uncharacterized protein (TIGR02145 family)